MNFNLPEQAVFYLQVLLSTSSDAVSIVNREGEVLYWNKGAEETYNIRQDEIIGKKIKEFFRKEDLMVLQMLETKEPVRNVYHRPRPDKHVMINSAPVYDAEKQLIGALSVEQDITHTVKLNEELSVASSELHQLKHQVYQKQIESPFSKIKGKSAAIQQAIQLAMKVAKTDATVLIFGESGVGKELFAQAIHETSLRKNKSFIPINCGAIPDALFESELFGYERGAYTGAAKEGKPGKIELADGGTLFLDEIGELPLDMQVKLLRVLQENEVYRIGGTIPKRVNVRVIAATNRDLDKMVEEGTFRSDLFYRLNVVSLPVPPLRDRIDDVPELVQFFLHELAIKYQKTVPAMPAESMQLFLQYDWPGNIRELRNIVERVMILAESGDIHPSELLAFFPKKEAVRITNVGTSLAEEKTVLEKERIEEALKKTYGNKSAAAKELGISRATLYQKIKRYGIISEKPR